MYVEYQSNEPTVESESSVESDPVPNRLSRRESTQPPRIDLVRFSVCVPKPLDSEHQIRSKQLGQLFYIVEQLPSTA
jgi:hypothetical protein